MWAEIMENIVALLTYFNGLTIKGFLSEIAQLFISAMSFVTLLIVGLFASLFMPPRSSSRQRYKKKK